MQQAMQTRIEFDSIGQQRFAISADDAASRRRKEYALAGRDRTAGDARFKLRRIAGLAKQIQLKRQQRFFDPGRCQFEERLLEPIEQFRMPIVLFKKHRHQLGAIKPGINAAEISPEIEMAFGELPFAKRRQLALGRMRKHGLPGIEQIDAAAKLARPRFGFAMCPFGDDGASRPWSRESRVRICEVSLYSNFRRQMQRSEARGIETD